ncbi:MAG: peroxiredoxin [Euryarchaeota archaeon]|nr:peroxiredoxin [Euryarchaeota archaeon]
MGEKIYELKRIKKKDRGMPLIGDKFPKIKVQTTHGMMKLPKEFKGKWFIFFSHPADFTPVCTSEFFAFQKRFDQFTQLNCRLIGLSVDQVFAHLKWTEWINENLNVKIMFPIVADTGKVANKLGLIHPAQGPNTVRAVFIVDPEGIIRAILYYPKELGRNIDEILRMIKGLQTVDEQGAAVPENWPDNELIEDRLIIPPAGDEKTAAERMKNFECFDWWFCHKERFKKHKW